MKKITGIRKRWMVNSISVVLFIVLLAVAAFSAAMGSYYYSTLSESLKQKAENAISSFDYYRTEAEYYDNARAVVAGEPNSDKLEVEYLDADGQIRFSSSDLTAFRSPGTPDIAEAISMKRTKVWIGADPSTGEHIMAASSPLMIDGEVVGVMRYVTSLNKVDKQIIIIVAIALGIGLGILGMVYFSNLYFIRSIVDPVAGITETAKRIAAGSYGVQIEKRYDDEIGALTDTINDMSLKINQSEKMKNEFISSVSHELRTPLTAINGWAETIMNGEVRDAGDVKKGMGIIVSEARRLTNMVRSCWSSPASRTAASPCQWSPWTSRRSWRMRSIPTGSSSGGRALNSTTSTATRSFRPSRGTRSGCGRCSATCWTTPPSTAARASALIPLSPGTRIRWLSPSGTTAPVSRPRSCPT